MHWTKKPLPRGYEHDLDELVNEVYGTAFDKGWTWRQLAERSDLCYGTVWAIGTRRTRRPHLTTVWKMAKACGLKVAFIETRPSVTRKRKEATYAS